MPPGGAGGRFGRGGGPRAHYARATLVGVLNSNASNDENARKKVKRMFIPLLGITFLLDIVCSLTMVLIKCHEDHDDGNDNMMICVEKELKHGLHFKPTEDNDGLGDFVWLALIRCIVTILLLWFGIKYGNNSKDQREQQQNDSNNEQQQQQDDSPLTTPLLMNGHHGGEHDNNNNEHTITVNGNDDDDTYTSFPPPSSSSHSRGGDYRRSQHQQQQQQQHRCLPCLSSSSSNSCLFKKIPSLRCCATASYQDIVLILLFITSTFYQVYAGLKVSLYRPSSSHTINPVLPVLMCLTILWINIISYFFRVLIDELTREDGLFLSSKVHRHPVFYEESRSLAVHWCDICRQRIKPTTNTTTSNANSNTTTGDNNNVVEAPGASSSGSIVACYRCSLCDFDICMKCAQRSDAATIGEDMLRGDHSGVRAENALDNKSYFSRILVVIKPELPLLFISLLLLASSSITRLLLPHFQGHIIDKVIPNPNTGEYDKNGFFNYIKLYVLLMIVQGAVSTLYSAIFTLVSRRLKFSIRNSLFDRILSQDVAYFDGTESGRLISRLTNDLDLMMSPIQSSLSSLLSNVLILIGGMIMCFMKSYRLSMLAFVTVGPITYLWNQYAQWSKGLAREMLAYWAEGNSIASQALSHIRTVKAFGCETHVIDKYTDTNKHALHCGVKDAWGNGLTSALTGYLDLGSGVLILYFGGLLVYEGEMSVGELVTFQLFWNMMNNAYQNLQGLVTSFTRSAAGAEKIFSLWESDPDIDPKKGADISWDDVRGDLQLQNVKFFYQMRPDNIVLEKFNLTIPAGKTVALVGRSGGGKSTIVNLLLRFYDAKEGKLIIDGKDYNTLKVGQLRRLFGVVTQETELFSLTVEENIAYGLNKDEYTMDDLVNAAKKAQAYEFISEMKDGFQTRIGERGNRLSGGQRQRIAIARVFLRKPKIILLDEATSALDEHSQEAVQRALSTLIADCNATVVLVAHRLTTVMNADSIVVIDKGTALEQGTHDELVALGGIYASMVQKQNKKMADELNQDNHHNDNNHNNDSSSSSSSSGRKVAIDDIDSLLADQQALKEQSQKDGRR